MREIGIKVNPPSGACTDTYCPFHGSLSTRGRLFTGRVASIAAKQMAVIERDFSRRSSKYMRLERRRRKLHAHLPPCISVTEGDTVRVAECRPLAKSVSFVVIEAVAE
jgi:small subunit ribosomal protein S17